MTPAHEREWRRVHPLSPWVRGWILLLALFIGIGRDWLEALVSGEEPRGWWSGLPGPLVMWGGGAVIALIAGGFLLSWWTTRYQLGEDTVRVRTGVLFRQLRQARLDRVEAVDVAQPLLARIFGLAELRFEVADAGESALRLSFLPLAEATALRATVMAAAARARSGEHAPGLPGEDAPGAAAAGEVPPSSPGQQEGLQVPSAAQRGEALVVAVPAARVLASTALTPGFAALVAMGAAAVTLDAVTGIRIGAVTLIPALLGAAAAVWSRINRSWNFRVSSTPEGLRLTYGLLEARTQTVPEGRIQAIGIRQPAMWRPFGWWSVRVNVAGYGRSSDGEQSKSVVLPVGSVEDVFRILGLIQADPGTGAEPGRAVFEAGLTGQGREHGFTHSPPSARWLDPLSWRRNGFRATDTALLCRSGWLARTLSIVPHERTQSLGLTQGPIERRLGLANVELHSTPGAVRPSVRHLGVAEAEALFGEQAARAATARRRPHRPRPHTGETARGGTPADTPPGGTA